jgi:hypothetical protein
MKNWNTIKALSVVISLFAFLATTTGIFYQGGSGEYGYKSIRGRDVTIYGKGLYKDMSSEVAVQGIAQDYVTLVAAIPVLLLSLLMVRAGSIKGRWLLAGTLGYFLVTYLFYTAMGMYNALFLVYVVLIGSAFYAFMLAIMSFDVNTIKEKFNESAPVKSTGSILIFIAIAIALLWLSIVVPPLVDGTVVPLQVEHYTTLIVQGLDLGILLPAAIISAILWMKKKRYGYLFAPIYFVFLSILMTALTAKVVGMLLAGFNVIPVIYIIPTLNLVTIVCTVFILKSINYRNAPYSANNYEKSHLA